MAKLFDSKCFELAEAFLEDEPSIDTHANRHALASDIQDAIESFIADKLRNYEPADTAPIGNTADDVRHLQTEAMKLK